MPKCPHIQECKQSIDSNRFQFCLGDVEDWDFNDCADNLDNELESQNKPRKFPKEWDEGTQ